MGATTRSVHYRCDFPYTLKIFNIGIKLNHVFYAIEICRAETIDIEDVEFGEVDIEFDTLFPASKNDLEKPPEVFQSTKDETANRLRVLDCSSGRRTTTPLGFAEGCVFRTHRSD